MHRRQSVMLWAIAVGGAIAAVLATILAPSGAQAQSGLIDGRNPEAIAALASTLGETRLSVDNLGDPLIRGEVDGKDYQLYFYGCSEGASCTNLMFSASWESAHYTDKSMGDWNREKRYGKAFLDEDGAPTIEMNVNLFGGVSRENMEDTLDWWRTVLTDFADFYGF